MVPMARTAWTLEKLVDFEAELARSVSVSEAGRRAAKAAAAGWEGAEARRAGLLAWLGQVQAEAGPRHVSAGRRFAGALALVTTVLSVAMVLAGVGAMLGLVDSRRGGVHVTLALAVLLGGQWLLLALAAGGWVVRRRVGDGFSGLQAGLGKIVRKTAGAHESAWWENLRASATARDAVLWRLARLAQAAGLAFNMGVLLGLSGLVLVKHTGFFWETTTDGAMHAALGTTVELLSLPWATWWPAAVPDAAVIEGSRWLPGRADVLPPGPEAWWLFLLAAVFTWGLLPRAVLWLGCWVAGRRALARLDFQSRGQRALWRDLSGYSRAESDSRPMDGVLVLDVGGTGLAEELLRPFLLRRLRVHPSAWESVAVLDPGAELAAAKALAKAPAGVVLLAEAWALSPPRMTALLGQVRQLTGGDTPVKFLAVNVGPGRKPLPPVDSERLEWERFVDSLGDPATEVFCYEAG